MDLSKRVSVFLSAVLFIFFVFSNSSIAQEDKQVYMTVEQMPQLQGDLDSLQNEIQYPAEDYKAKREGRVIIQFVVNKEGKAEDLNVLRGISQDIDKEAKKLIKEANFTPGKQRGKAVNVQYQMPVIFDLSEHPKPENESNEGDEEENEEDFFVAVENMPELKGGLAGLQSKIEYPEMARKAGIEGRVIVKFIVNKEGRAENPKVARGIGGGCDQEALRLIKQAEFEPGRQRGEKVRVQYSLPITFKLQQ